MAQTDKTSVACRSNVPQNNQNQRNPSLHLVVQLYKGSSSDELRRMIQCIEKNINLDFIGNITIAAEKISIKAPPKVRIVQISERSTYAALLKLAFNEGHAQTTHVAIANTDIYLDDTLKILASKITKKTSVAAISRREADGTLYANPKLSQDLWLFAYHKPAAKLLSAAEYQLGIAGCEHLFAMALRTNGYDIWNPCIDCTIHHNDPKPRTSFEKRYSGAYLYLPPCEIADVESSTPRYEVAISPSKFQEGPTRERVQNLSKLHLCCGDKKIDGYLGVDVRREVAPDIEASLDELGIFSDKSISEVYFCHGPEHLSTQDVETCLREIRRILTPGGILRVAMPDFDALIDVYATGRATLNEIRLALYGGQDYAENVHKSAWTFRSFEALLRQCGFSEISRYDPSEFLPKNYYDYSMHQISGTQTSLNIRCTSQ